MSKAWSLVLVCCLVAVARGDGGLAERGMRPKVLTPITTATAQNRFAIVVGVDTYTDDRVPDLRYAGADAQAVVQYFLAEGGIPADNLWQLLDQNASREVVERVLGDELPKRAKPGDLVFFYFAGHGYAATGGELVLMLRDTDPDRLVSTGLTSSRLGELLRYLGEVRLAVLLDTCFSGGAGGRAFVMPQQGAGPAGSFGDRLRGSGRFILCASRADEPAFEGEAYGHGVFTNFLLEGFRVGDGNADGQLTFAELYDHVYERVRAATNDRQHPDQTSTGNLALVTRAEAAATAGGTLKVTSNPLGAKVYLDGLPAGSGAEPVVTPTAELPVKAGHHRVTAYRAGFEVGQAIVEVPAGQARAVNLDLLRETPLAALLLTNISADWAGAAVTVNGTAAGQLAGSELYVPGLRAGQPAALKVEQPGYLPFEQSLTLQAGEVRAVPVTLKPQPREQTLPAGLAKLDDGTFRWSKDGAVLVWVPPGRYRIGTDDKDWFLALPAHEVALGGFWMDRCEVTLARFRAFVTAAGYTPRGPWGQTAGPDDCPVANVTLADATAYASWAGLALPTEDEWEAAARGAEGWVYPYHATSFNELKANVPRTRVGRTTPVGRFSRAGGDSPLGLADLSGNVAEWTTGRLTAWPGHPTAADKRFSEALAVLRGGSFRSADSKRDSTAFQRLGVPPDRWAADIGFRCVLRQP